ncbi:hypothetical protein EDC04DRAFT_912265 [Pisolithus marmoratus]|nr:hypothetical protein EDC04DRAFT_912265 [Pisolithus marmoratus]
MMMTLTSVPNSFDDATHEALDIQVNEFVLPLIGVEPTGRCLDHALLLIAVAGFSNGTLNSLYTSHRTVLPLIERHPELASMLHTAWSNKAYRDIRNLEILQAPRLEFTAEEDVLYKAFTSPYHGKAADAFYEYLERNNAKFSYIPLQGGPPQYYGKFCSIVQSSGTGKSRLLLELSRKGVVVLYMNIRPLSDKTAFPPRDAFPAEMLTANLGTKADYGARCCAFFAAVFTMISDRLSTTLASGSLAHALKLWNESMCNFLSRDRPQFFVELQAEYDSYYAKINSKVPKHVVDDRPSNFSISGEEHVVQSIEHEEQAITGMRGLEYIGGYHKPKLVIALDEAEPLSVTTPDGYCPSTVLCQAISLYSGGGARIRNDAVWVVFVSTSSKVADCATPWPHYASARVPADGQMAYPPYSQLGWDQQADSLKGIAATDVAQAGHIIGYGRPLWKSIQGGSVHEMVVLVVSKLFGPEKSENLPLAVLSQRFYLNVTLGHYEAAHFIASSVANHLRVYITLPDDRSWSFTTYPSEPFVSCAAALLLHAKGNLDIFLGVLEEKILSGMIDVGKSGEVASRLLWPLAKDLFIRRTPHCRSVIPAADGQEWKSELADCQMIPVIDYLHFIFGPRFCDRAGKAAKEAFKHAYINFSHWVRMDENISISKNRGGQLDAGQWTLRHWHRTSAVQCCHNQPLVDKMIPIYFKDCPGKTDLSHVSQIFISDRTERSSSLNDLHNITRSHDSIKCHSPLPWVAILVDLGLEESAVEVKFTDDPTDGPCLRIYAAAIDVRTFPFLTKSRRLPSTLQKIIAHDQIHGRQLEKILWEQMQYGNSPTARHMEWEAGANTSH